MIAAGLVDIPLVINGKDNESGKTVTLLDPDTAGAYPRPSSRRPHPILCKKQLRARWLRMRRGSTCRGIAVQSFFSKRLSYLQQLPLQAHGINDARPGQECVAG